MKLKSTVILAYTDIAAAGSRALLGLAEAGLEEEELSLPALTQTQPACTDRGTQHKPLSARHCAQKDISVLIVNSIVPASHVYAVVDEIISLCSDSQVKRLLVVSCLRVDLPSAAPERVYENALYAKPVMGLSPLPDHAKISDAFFISLIQLLQVERLATSCLTVAGHRARLGRANTEDGSLTTIELLQKTLSDVLKLQFDAEKTRSLEYRGVNAVEDDPVSLMYS